MSERYEKAPVIEAVIDLRVTLAEDVGSDVFLDLKGSLEESFSEHASVFEIQIQSSENQEHANVRRNQTGFRLASSDNRRILIVGTGGFTFSYVSQYQTWDQLRDEARVYWNMYKEACSPVSIERVSVRYINRFDVPSNQRLNSLISLYPVIPQDLPEREALSTFFVQLQIPQRDINSVLVINQTKVDAPNPDTTSIVLDFDLLRNEHWPIDHDFEAWAVLETLRVRKNEVFNACITQKMKDLIR